MTTSSPRYNKLETDLSPQQWVNILNEPEKILNINFNGQGLEELPDLTHLTNLKVLLAGHNRLKTLPLMSKSVEIISLFNNEFTEIPYISSNITQLLLDDNKIIEAIIPETLETLSLCSNPIIRIKFMGKFRCKTIKYLGNLKKMYLYNTPLYKVVDKIPKNIVEIWYEIIRVSINSRYYYYNDKETLQLCIRIKIWNTMMVYYFGRNVTKRLLATNVWNSIENKVKEKYAPNKLLEILDNLGEDCSQEEFDLAIANW